MNRPPSSGPSTVVTPKTAPSAPWYLPRSRSGMTSAISAVAVTIRPPAPKPWTARQRDQPASCCWRARRAAEPTTKMPAPTWKTSLRPNRSPNLPASTVAIVSASRYDDDDPGQVPGAAEVADDRRQRGRDDRLVERGQQHAEQHRDEHQVHPAPVEDRLCCRGVGRGRSDLDRHPCHRPVSSTRVDHRRSSILPHPGPEWAGRSRVDAPRRRPGAHAGSGLIDTFGPQRAAHARAYRPANA